MATIAYVLCSNPQRTSLASTRISVLNTFNYLRREGHNPFILHQPSDGRIEYTPALDGIVEMGLQQYNMRPGDVVYFQQVYGPDAIAAVRQFAERGIRTILGICDIVEPGMAEACHMTLVPSDFLKGRYPADMQERVNVIHDGIEHPHIYKKRYSTQYATASMLMKAVVITSERLERLPVIGEIPDYVEVTVHGAYEKRTRMNAENPPQSFLGVPWHESVFQKLSHYDIGLIPVELSYGSRDFHFRNSKSANRLTQLMNVGLPVIASDIPTYGAIVTTGTNGFIAKSPREWIDFLKELRNGNRRERMGKAARNIVKIQFSQETQALELSELINALSQAEMV